MFLSFRVEFFLVLVLLLARDYLHLALEEAEGIFGEHKLSRMVLLESWCF